MFKGIIDITLRDGQQSPLLFDSFTYRFNLEHKKKLVKGLINLGVRHLEFFAPVVSSLEKEEFLEIKQYVRSITAKKIMLLAHCRCTDSEIEQAVEAGFDGLNLYMNGTKNARTHSYKKNFSQLRAHIKRTIQGIRKKYPKLYIRFSIEDAFRTSQRDMYAIFDSIYGLVNTFGIPDTVGMATPTMVAELVNSLKTRYPKVDLECHFHNDRGLALVNTITAIQSGVSYTDTSIWGLAERSGIASTTGILLNLHKIDKSYTKAYNLKLCYPVNILMGTILNMHVPYNEPVSVTNRTHIAGVHHKAVLHKAKIYEAHHLEKFGVTKNQILLGPLSGWNLIYYYLREIEYYDITPEQAKKISRIFKDESKKISRQFKPEMLLDEIVKRYHLSKLLVQEQYLEKRIENLN